MKVIQQSLHVEQTTTVQERMDSLHIQIQQFAISSINVSKVNILRISAQQVFISMSTREHACGQQLQTEKVATKPKKNLRMDSRAQLISKRMMLTVKLQHIHISHILKVSSQLFYILDFFSLILFFVQTAKNSTFALMALNHVNWAVPQVKSSMTTSRNVMLLKMFPDGEFAISLEI